MKITPLPPSPIHLLEERVSRLSHCQLLTFSAFCTQASIKNLDVFLTAAEISELGSKLDIWLWQKLHASIMDFPYDYQAAGEELDNLVEKFRMALQQDGISPRPNPMMANQSISIFVSSCSLFAGRGDISRLLNAINNCITYKIDSYYRGELGIKIYTDHAHSLPSIRSFPVYFHALADLEWALTVIERDDGSWISNDTLDMLKIYAENCKTFIVEYPFYYLE
jgi:hypothetical protein